MKRYEKFVLEAEKGITFDVLEGTSGELIIRAVNIVSNNVPLNLQTVSAGEYAEVLSVYTDSYGNKAVVPTGWTVSGAKKENTIWGKNEGLVIYRIPKEKVSTINWSNKEEVANLQKNYDQLTWCPVEKLDSNGTLDGEHFSEKFGRRNYRQDRFSDDVFNEPLSDELLRQLESVKKYGGFYISRYHISKAAKGKTQSVKGAMPWVNINWFDAKEVASTMEQSREVTSHLTFGAEYDSVLEWFMKSGAKSRKEIVEDSTGWGNYWNTKNSPKQVVETGSREEWSVNNICDFAGNVGEWTQEKNESSDRVIRGREYNQYGDDYPVAYRSYDFPDLYFNYTGFRATLYIK